MCGGGYLVFVDSDDWIEKDYIGTLLQYREDSVLVLTGRKKEEATGIILTECYSDEEVSEVKEQWFWKLYRKNFANSPCGKLYDMKVIKRYQLRFPDELDLGEDLIFNLSYYVHMNKCVIINHPLYAYSYSGTSLSHKIRENKKEIKFYLYQQIKNYCEKYGEMKEEDFLAYYFMYYNTFLFDAEQERKNKSFSRNVRNKKYREIIESREMRNIITDIKEYKKNLSFLKKTDIFMIENRLFLLYRISHWSSIKGKKFYNFLFSRR